MIRAHHATDKFNMHRQKSRAALAALFLLGLGGCTAFSGGKSTDTPANTRAALEIPPDLARPAGDDTAVVAPGGAATLSDFAAKPGASTPAPAAGAPATSVPSTTPARVRLERDGAQRWLVVQDAPDNVFARARAYLLRNNYKLIVDSPKTGLLETDWIERPMEFSGTFSRIVASLSSTGLRDKFRIRIEAGRVAGTTEVYVSQQGLEQVVKPNSSTPTVTETIWQPHASDPILEADLLARLMEDFGLDSQQAKNELASAATARAQRVKNAVVLVQQDFDSSWRRVGQAMDRAGVAIEDLDRNAGIYYVRYASGSGKKQGSGLFGLFGGSTDNKDDVPQDRFQVVLKTQADGIRVMIRNIKGESDYSAEAEALLQLLYQQLR